MIDLQGPAYVIRRPSIRLRAETARFHRALGFAVVRDTDHGQFFAAGDTWGIKTVYAEAGFEVANDAALIPIVVSGALVSAIARITAHRHVPVEEVAHAGVRTVYYRAPDGGLVGVTDREPYTAQPADALPDGAGAFRDHRGTRFVERRAARPDAVAGWYRDVLGLRVVDTLDRGSELERDRTLDLGEGVALRVVGGGADRGTVAGKDDVPDALMIRVHRFDAVCRRLVEAGATWLGEPVTFPTGTSVVYLADPEGVVVCVAERAEYPPNSEDVVAHQRWQAGRANNTAERSPTCGSS